MQPVEIGLLAGLAVLILMIAILLLRLGALRRSNSDCPRYWLRTWKPATARC